MTRNLHGTSKDNPLGNGHAFAEDGNKLAVFCANGIRLIAYTRSIYILEQPMSSVLVEHPDMKLALEEADAVCVLMLQGWTGAFSDKPTCLYRNAPYAHCLQKFFEKKLFTTNVNRYMTASAAYPIEFCHMVCATHHQWSRGLKHEFYCVLKLAVWPLLRSKTHISGGPGRRVHSFGDIGLMIYTFLMV